MWVAAGAALGTRYGWPALLVAIKPSLALFTLTGVLHRSWWLGLPLLALASIPFGWLWIEWIAVVWHAPAGLDYSLLNAPFPAAVMIAAWAAKKRTSPRPYRSRDRTGVAGALRHFRRSATLRRQRPIRP